MRALVIDDSRAVRSVICRTLAELGFAECVQAGNGQEALAALEERGPFQLAMVDWNMPVMNGYDFVVAARTRISSEQMKIVMCTTETEAEQISKALAAGADEYVMKPFTKEAIQSKLEMLGLIGG
ncbi:MAG: response regulator [Planctomycetota bacterium]|nr:response regulator [Planctomycetota bacterium]MDW8372042.1 response regulator [Planctomycetota bacterium]